MTIASEISRLQGAKADIKTAIENKGVTVGNITLDNYAACIDAISGESPKVDFLLIGGGGGGGKGVNSSGNTLGGGGGGAGGVFCGTIGLYKGAHTVTIGAKGTPGANGGASSLDGFIAPGGGAGGVGNGLGCPGGSGGGGGGSSGCKGGYGVLGYCGGCGARCSNSHGAGGGGGGYGGAGGNGTMPSSVPSGGAGGIGLCTCITGHYECFAGGGGGRGYCGGRGCYGGGNSCCDRAPTNATTCGSGGAGGDISHCSCNGSCGAGGLLIISYPSDCGYNISGASCSCVCNGVCVHCFTSSGTLTVS